MADSTRPTDRKAPAQHVTELKDLILGYARQETIDPLKTLGRYLGAGLGGAALIGLGCWFLLLGLLRGLQSIDRFAGTGAWSLIPYVATIGAAGVLVALAVVRMSKPDSKELSR